MMAEKVQSSGASNGNSQSKQAIMDCGGDMEKILDKLEFLQKTTEYDSVSLLALKRYAASIIIRSNELDVYSLSER